MQCQLPTIIKAPQKLPGFVEGSVVLIGNFDGVHKGHQAILAAGKAKADALNLPLVALTFDPHPREVLSPEKAPQRLTHLPEKADLLKAHGADIVYVISFTKAYAQTPADAFIKQTLAAALKAKHIIVGADFAFGKGRGGDVDALKTAGVKYGFDVTAVAPEGEGGAVYSSTAVREAIAAGDNTRARRILGHDIKRLTGEKS